MTKFQMSYFVFPVWFPGLRKGPLQSVYRVCLKLRRGKSEFVCRKGWTKKEQLFIPITTYVSKTVILYIIPTLKFISDAIWPTLYWCAVQNTETNRHNFVLLLHAELVYCRFADDVCRWRQRWPEQWNFKMSYLACFARNKNETRGSQWPYN